MQIVNQSGSLLVNSTIVTNCSLFT